ncbi:MAG: hypothetical protein JNL72_05985 [Flavipsychrobacter sp.]|nr:hypothetical protein [Flavipsychrobacter sp.]
MGKLTAPINLETIESILNSTAVVNEPPISFPQANSFERVINLCELLIEKVSLTRQDITNNYDFDARQTNYYTDAGRYLGLIEKRSENTQIVFTLSDLGYKLFKKPFRERQLEFAKLILSHKAFKKTLELYFKKAEIPTQTDVVEIMKESKIYNVNSEKTFFRRASTVTKWINWIIELVEE